MQTITVNSQYDVSNNLIDYDLLFKELELCFKTCGKTFYVRPKALVANQFYNENGKAIKRVLHVGNTMKMYLKVAIQRF